MAEKKDVLETLDLYRKQFGWPVLQDIDTEIRALRARVAELEKADAEWRAADEYRSTH